MALGKKMLLLAAFCGIAWGQTGLTTIQDTLFKADGTRFSGTLAIHWNTFDTTNPGTIVQQSTTVSVVNGNLQLSLAPNAGAQPPANVYTVQYQSDGREQFAETWTVPVSTAHLPVSSVRTGTLSTSGIGAGQTGGSTSIPESSVIGLQADLAQRPLKGVGFGTDAVAVVNDNGQIETVVGDVGDCVFVDGTAGPCAPPVFADAETPGGIVDGANNTLTLQNTPLGSSLMLFRNGLYMTPNFDYTLSGSTLHFVAGAVPQAGDTLTASYRVDTSAGGYISLVTPGGGVAAMRTGAAGQVICNAAGVSTSAAGWTTLGKCDIPAQALNSGDRIEARFTFAHTGTASGFNLQVDWGSTTVLARSGTKQDEAVTGRAEAAIETAGAQIGMESWGTVLPFLPGILRAPAQSGLQIAFKAAMANAGSDIVALTNYTVLRYPGN
ncbi:MAG: hypothetical protein M3N93_02060 [Acidobacteriota bacterium]|nr:hypothetical protein [Acidobacteriota bacterium]